MSSLINLDALYFKPPRAYPVSDGRPMEVNVRAARIVELDGLRGVAIGMVFLFHFAGWMSVQYSPPVLKTLFQALSYGWAGVGLFFVLSGFLITSILLETKGQRNYFRNFYMRRALRILPAYYGCLTAAFIIFRLVPATRSAFPDMYRLEAWYWIYLQNWLVAAFQSPAPDLGFLAHFWSLAIEEQFYLIWPFLVYLLSPSRLAIVCTSLIIASLLVRICLALTDPSTAAQQFMYFSTITRIDCLSLGAVAAALIRLGITEGLLRKIVGVALSVSFLCLAVIIAFDPLHSMWGNIPMAAVGLTATGLASLGVLLHVVRAPPRLLRKKSLRLMGKYSYGLYLYHFPVIIATDWVLKALGIAGAAYALWFGSVVPLLTVTLTLLSWHFLEMWFLPLKDKFS